MNASIYYCVLIIVHCSNCQYSAAQLIMTLEQKLTLNAYLNLYSVYDSHLPRDTDYLSKPEIKKKFIIFEHVDFK